MSVASKASVRFWRDGPRGKANRTVPYPVELNIPGSEIGGRSPQDDVQLLMDARSARRIGNALATLGAKATAAQRRVKR